MSIMSSTACHNKTAACDDHIGHSAFKSQLPIRTRTAIDLDEIRRSHRLSKPDLSNAGYSRTGHGEPRANFG